MLVLGISIILKYSDFLISQASLTSLSMQIGQRRQLLADIIGGKSLLSDAYLTMIDSMQVTC